MGSNLIYSAIAIPATASRPSQTCVQWSADGQLILATKSAIYLFTPELGIYFDNESVIRAPVGKDTAQSKGRNALGWFRNLIEFDKAIQHHWPQDSQEWGILSLGSLDVSCRMVTASPSNLSPRAGCVLVAMSSNMELTLWCPTKNHLKGEWIEVQDITAYLKTLQFVTDTGHKGDEEMTYLRTLNAQVNCIAWSQQTDFGLVPDPVLDGSILALGTRTGSVHLLRYDGTHAVEHIQSCRVCDGWVTSLAWTWWKNTEQNVCECYIACGTGDGAVVVVKLRQSIEPMESSAPFANDLRIQLQLEVLLSRPSEADNRGITASGWIDARDKEPTLVYVKPGVLHFWRINAARRDRGEHLCSIRLRTQKISVGSSALTPASGLLYLEDQDTLIVGLFDGSFHTVYSASTSPTLDRDIMVDNINQSLTSFQLTKTIRAAFAKVESSDVQKKHVNRTSGSMSFDGFNTVAWFHELSLPTDFSYKQDAKHQGMLVVAEIWDSPDDYHVLRMLERFFAESTTGPAPIHILRGAYLHLRHLDKFLALHTRILEIILPPTIEDCDVVVPSWTGTVDSHVRGSYRRSLSKHLYGWQNLHSLRLRLGLADFCWRLAPNDDIREEFGLKAQILHNAISHRLLHTLLRHASAVITVLTPNDVPFILRIIVQSLVPGSPPRLSAEADDLLAKLKQAMSASPEILNLQEKCPACSADTELRDLITAVCTTGHIWPRCSITSFVLSTPMVRTCIGCTRKALLPPTQMPDIDASLSSMPEGNRSWIVEELLEAAQSCLYCGNRFIRIL